MVDKRDRSSTALELIDYPSQFSLKVFGNQSVEFEDIVLALIKAHSPQTEHFEVSSRSSKAGKYVALTIKFTVQNQKQLENIYQDLHDCEYVVMSL